MDGIADVVAGLEQQQHALAGLLEPLDADGWRRPTRCEGWDVADVVLHLAQTNELAIGSVTGRFAAVLDDLTAGAGAAGSIDDGAALMVARERGAPTGELLARWRSGAAELRRVLLAADPHERVVWVAGELSVRTLATTRLAETWIHTGDVAGALGHVVEPTDHLRHIARLVWRTLPYAFARGWTPRTGADRVSAARSGRRTMGVRSRRARSHDHHRKRRRPLHGCRASSRARRYRSHRHRTGRRRRPRARPHLRLTGSAIRASATPRRTDRASSATNDGPLRRGSRGRASRARRPQGW